MPRDQKVQTTIAMLQLIGITIGAVYVNSRLNDVSQQLSQTTIAHENAMERERQVHALELVRRFNSEPMVSLRDRATKVLWRTGSATESEMTESEIHDVRMYVNFHEEMALSVSENVAYEPACFKYFQKSLKELCSCGEFYLEKHKDRYIHMRDLNRTWEYRPRKIVPSRPRMLLP